MILRERWLIAAIVGMAFPLVLVAGRASPQQSSGADHGAQSGSGTSGQAPAPAKAVLDPDAPPPDDPQAAPPRRDDDLAPEPDAAEEQNGQGGPPPQSKAPQGAADEQPAQKNGMDHSSNGPAAAAPSVGGQKGSAAPLVLQGEAVSRPSEPQKHGKYDEETTRLITLTQELKAEVDKAGANTLSLAALRKADEIQRVAKDLKERMRGLGNAVVGKP